ncbi:MAG: hypothetical protein V4519_03175 [Patescibacteria group bacterium]
MTYQVSKRISKSITSSHTGIKGKDTKPTPEYFYTENDSKEVQSKLDMAFNILFDAVLKGGA